MESRPPDTSPSTRSSDWLPEWANPVTLRGLILLLAGVLILAIPDATRGLLSLIVQIGLILGGLTTVWGALRRSGLRLVELLIGVAMTLAGLALAVWPDATARVVSGVIGAVGVMLGIAIAMKALRRRRTDENWVFDVVRGGLYVGASAVLIIIPGSIAGTVVFGLAVAAVVVGGLTLAIGLSDADDASQVGTGELGAYARQWLEERDVGQSMRDEVIDSLYFEPPDAVQKQVGFWVLLVLSTAIATLGVMADSTAVVIGAMLVAPLMTPIMGVSAGIVNGWVRRVMTAFATVAGGVVVSISTAWIVATWTPQLIPLAQNSQVLSRVSPTLIDMMIAVAAGAAGAYATIDKRVSSSITGVAIAVALVPPLAVVGVTLEGGEAADALGSFLLFATNLVSIILVASLVFVIGGLAPIDEMRRNSGKMRTIIGTVLLGAIVIIVPLTFTSEGIIVSASRQSTAQRLTAEWVGDTDDIRINRVTVSGTDVQVLLSGEGNLPSVDDLDGALEEAFKEPVAVTIEFFPSSVIKTNR